MGAPVCSRPPPLPPQVLVAPQPAMLSFGGTYARDCHGTSLQRLSRVRGCSQHPMAIAHERYLRVPEETVSYHLRRSNLSAGPHRSGEWRRVPSTQGPACPVRLVRELLGAAGQYQTVPTTGPVPQGGYCELDLGRCCKQSAAAASSCRGCCRGWLPPRHNPMSLFHAPPAAAGRLSHKPVEMLRSDRGDERRPRAHAEAWARGRRKRVQCVIRASV